MASLRGACKKSRKASTNPYAGRGLDKFALVSAELEAKRENLAAQLETPLSMVKFALGSHNEWVPIILSARASMRKGSHGTKKKSAALFPEGKLAVDGKGKGFEPDVVKEEKTHATGFIHGNGADLGGGKADNKQITFLNEFSFSQDIHSDALFSRNEALSSGGFLGAQKNDFGEIIEVFSASTEVERIEAEVVLHASNGKRSRRGSWVTSKASTLASNVIFFRRRTQSSVRKQRFPEENTPLPEREGVNEARALSAARVSSSSAATSSSSPSAQMPAVSPELVPLPLPPARIKVARNSNATDQATSPDTTQESGSPAMKEGSKKLRKGRSRCSLAIRSAPSTPRHSREPQKPFSTAGSLTKAQGLNGGVAHSDLQEQQRSIVQINDHNTQNVPVKSFFIPRVSASEKAQKERSRMLGQALAATGLILSLSGLMMGYVLAIVAVVCWWYVLPRLRKAVGDKPVVRRHHNNAFRSTDKNIKSNKTIRVARSGKYDTQSSESRKKVIMEGFLDRGLRSNS